MLKLHITLLLAFFFVGGIICQSDDSDILSDEEITINPIPNITETQQTSSDILKSTTASTVRRQFKLDAETVYKFRYEVAAIVCIFLYLILYRRGKAQNIQIMENFYKKIRAYVDQNFSHIGFTKNSGEDPFVAESPSQAMFYASGRQNVQYLQIKFNMLKRQDLIYHLIYETIYPEKDMITIDIPVQTYQPIILCVANHRKLKHITQKCLDLAKLAGTFQVKGLNSNLHVLGEASQIVDALLDSNICKRLNDISPILYSIHYTDQKLFSESEGHIRATIYASDKHQDKYLPALQLLFQLVDRIKDVKIPANYRTKAFKAREAFNASVEKEKMEKHKQQLKKKKEEKRKQQQAWLRSLPPEKQKKEDEKRKKKQINKLLKSRVMKVA